MALSLQDQLLKAGLADKKKAKKIKQEKHKQVKAKQKHKAVIEDEAKIAASEALEAKKSKDRLLAKKQKEERLQKEIAAQVIDLIKVNAQSRKKGDLVLNFTVDNLVKRMYVDQKMHKLVTQGRLSVVSYEPDVYELVPTPVADKIKQRMPESVIYQATEIEQDKNESDDDDWYADYEIPDDLVW
ncbi:DUF2058 domain-containing protein [Glaciecola sp. MH2013]|uniref:DUF2058 domain-containing protein n=1 Tax=Glaciecola sp. MH2013 TaxID=2785524 RepID=UPI00189D48F9|nr:DUF2058 domain-containing protein [Glaciecola sp. MH2013]MBF7072923.1 DUF2058 domain-containing protein [Glaciecola sp. MH2013]